ncbi:MAG: hypothetical protein MZW92_24080 [Comamonadaceae bacterium]|nr:hypothetical protein [Comamonadaceae bacterium]
MPLDATTRRLRRAALALLPALLRRLRRWRRRRRRTRPAGQLQRRRPAGLAARATWPT